MSKDVQAHPRIWWDGQDLFVLMSGPHLDEHGRSRTPKAFRVDSEFFPETIGPIVELRAVVPPAEVRDRAENVIRDQIVAHGLGLLSAIAVAAMAVDDLRAEGLLAAEPTGTSCSCGDPTDLPAIHSEAACRFPPTGGTT